MEIIMECLQEVEKRLEDMERLNKMNRGVVIDEELRNDFEENAIRRGL